MKQQIFYIEQDQENGKINSAYEMWKLRPNFQCMPCAIGCEKCEDDAPCIVTLNWVLRTILLILQCIIMCCLPIVVLFTYKYQDVKVRYTNTIISFTKYKTCLWADVHGIQSLVMLRA